MLKPEVRSLRGRRLARAAMARHRLAQKVVGLINAGVIKTSYIGEIALKAHARRVWAALMRTTGRSE